jgi:hypothetical protein
MDADKGFIEIDSSDPRLSAFIRGKNFCQPSYNSTDAQLTQS